MEPTYSMKIAMLGESGVGKTCILDRYVSDAFNEFTDLTKGASFKAKSLKSQDERIEIKQMLWDTAGQEIYRSLAPFYYKDADAVIVVYDITNEKSFEALAYWIGEVKQNGSPECSLTIAGNKCDCVDAEKVDANMARDFAKNEKAGFFLTSAKDNLNIREMFVDIAMRKFEKLRKDFGYKDEKEAKSTINSEIIVKKPVEKDNKFKLDTGTHAKTSEMKKKKKCC